MATSRSSRRRSTSFSPKNHALAFTEHRRDPARRRPRTRTTAGRSARCSSALDGSVGSVERRGARCVEEEPLRLDSRVVAAGLALGPAQGSARRAERLRRARARGCGAAPPARRARRRRRHRTTRRAPRSSPRSRPRGASCPRTSRRRVHLALLPMDDAEENAVIVNALQRRADVVAQKSLAEGFGLTVAEAMWKGAPGGRRRGRRYPGPDRRRPHGLPRRPRSTSVPSASG